MGRYFKVVNFEKFQHYGDRTPPWIKFHASVLVNYEFGQLSDTSKAHLVLIWVLASQKGNKLPYDESWISTRIQAKSKINLKEFERLGFIECYHDADTNASNALASIKSTFLLEERREEKEEEKEKEEKEFFMCPHEELLKTFHETCTDLNRVHKLTDARNAALKARWKDHSDMSFWQGFFRRVHISDFLCGRSPPRNGDQSFKADFEWIIKLGNFVKIIEGRYDNRGIPKQKTWLDKKQEEAKIESK